MPFFPDSSSYPKKLSSEYQLYACGDFFGHSSILEKIAILGQPPRESIGGSPDMHTANHIRGQKTTNNLTFPIPFQ